MNTDTTDGTAGHGGTHDERTISGPQKPSSTLRVLGMGALLLALIGVVLTLAVPRGAQLESDEILGELFVSVALPLPYALTVDGARKLPSGERVVTFGIREGSAAGTTAGGPVELTIVEYPASNGEKVLADQFRRLRFATEEEGGHGGRRRGGERHGGDGEEKKEIKPKLQEKAFLPWHGFDATFARLRHISAPEVSPKAFHEVVRVNLSTGGRCIIAYVRFGPDAVGDRDAAAKVVAAFTPRT